LGALTGKRALVTCGSRGIGRAAHCCDRSAGGRLQDESWPAFIDSVVVVWPRPRRVQVPVLVMGAEHDGFFTAAEMDRTAAAYRTAAEIIPGMGLT
jgi:pimeloyl-ACP methyl ester carboxylesterase